MTAKAMDLKQLAEHLGVNYWRARRWRRNAINNVGDVQLLAPDVLANPPRWSAAAVEDWARQHALWPPGVDQYECPVCHRFGSVYTPDEMIMREHGWSTSEDDDTLLVACGGSGQRAVDRHSALAAA